jgi:hypothetical protein
MSATEIVSLNNVNSGTGDSLDLGCARTTHTMIVVGPSTVDVYLEISHDGASWCAVGAVKYGALSNHEHAARYARARIQGTTNTPVTVTVAGA